MAGGLSSGFSGGGGASSGSSGATLTPIKLPTKAPAMRRPTPTGIQQPAVAPTSSSSQPPSTVNVNRGVNGGGGTSGATKGTTTHNPAAAHTNPNSGVTKTTPGTNPLQPLTQQQIVDEAKNIAQSTYKSQFGMINAQQTQALGIDQKRAADQKYYDNWLASTGAALQTANSNIMTSLEHANAAAQASANTGLNAANPTLSQQVNSETGMAYNTGGADAALLNGNSTSDKALVSDAAQLSNTEGALGSQKLGVAEQYGLALQSSTRNTQLTALQDTLDKLQASRDKVQSDQAAAVAKEIASLQTNNINLAEYKNNTQLAMTKLGMENKYQQGTLAVRNRQLTVEAQRNAITQWNDGIRNKLTAAAIRERATKDAAAITQRWTALDQAKAAKDQQFQIDKQRLGLDGARLAFEERKAAAAAGGTSPLTATQSRDSFNYIDTATAQLRQLMQQRGLSAQQAVALMKSGGQYQIKAPGATGKVENKTISVTPFRHGEALLNAALEIARFGYVTNQTLNALNKQGLYGVRQRYKIGGNPPAGAGGM